MSSDRDGYLSNWVTVTGEDMDNALYEDLMELSTEIALDHDCYVLKYSSSTCHRCNEKYGNGKVALGVMEAIRRYEAGDTGK